MRSFREIRTLFPLTLLALAAGCAHEPAREPAAAQDDDSGWAYTKPRVEYLKQMKVWTGGSLEEQLARIQALTPSEIVTGPKVAGGFENDGTIECRHIEKKMGGMTPKFLCDDTAYAGAAAHKKPFKVKYGRFNQEVYGAVAATRLYWVLGFPAVPYWHEKVVCHGCSDEPAKKKQDLGPDVTQVFEEAAVQAPKPGKKMEEYDDQAWNFDELRIYTGTAQSAPGGSSRAERDALMLLAGFTQGRDNKGANNGLFCTKPGPKNEAGLRDCDEVVGMMTDLGITFGGSGITRLKHKPLILRLGPLSFMIGVRLKEWTHNRVWKKSHDDCTAHLWDAKSDEWFGHNVGLTDPLISEEGREFLARLLGALSDAQIAAIFQAAHVTELDTGTKIDDWVKVFKDKVEQVRSARCWTAAELDARRPFKPSRNYGRHPHVPGS